MITGLNIDRFYKVKEGDATAAEWQVPTFQLHVVPDGAAPSTGLKTAGVH